jgi:beta-lactamase class A
LWSPLLRLPRCPGAASEIDRSGQLAGIEAKAAGRLGVAVLDSATGRVTGYRADERFPMCSTFKLLAAACVLARVDRNEERLERRVTFTQHDLLAYSPATKDRAGGEGMTMAELCEAAVTLSDNTAANLILATFGGPSGLTRYARSLGDDVTRLDRIEPDLNEAIAGDPRDTTSPAAMAADAAATVLGNALSPASRDRLAAWLVSCKTGDKRLRAGFPPEWRVGDKTGTGRNGATGDAAIVWPPGRPPLVVAVYMVAPQGSADSRNEVFAEVARLGGHLLVTAGRGTNGAGEDRGPGKVLTLTLPHPRRGRASSPPVRLCFGSEGGLMDAGTEAWPRRRDPAGGPSHRDPRAARRDDAAPDRPRHYALTTEPGSAI